MLSIATRGSALARWQAQHVMSSLRSSGVEVAAELVIVSTSGDQRVDVPIWEMGGKGVFVKEVQAAVLDGRARMAVHSAKDLPSTAVPGLVLGAVPERGDPRDVLVGSTLDALAPGARVATGSVRRRAQISYLRPDLTFCGLRGNIATRLERIPPGGAIVMAAAAIDRLDLEAELTERSVVHEVLSSEVLLPQVGQGALAVECRADDEEALAALGHIEHEASRRAVDAERAFLAFLGGDCDLPAGAHAVVTTGGSLVLDAMVASPDGHVVLRDEAAGDDPAELGALLAKRLLERGGATLLDR